jgi:protein-tyrosine phosphatase
MKNVLFVCLGNICRSPIAEGIFRHLADASGVGDQIHVDSAGTASYHIGEFPDKRARQVCEERGIKLTHRARAFTRDDFDQYDYILAMDKQNLHNIEKLKPGQTDAKVMLIRDFDQQHKGAEVPDPYYGEKDGFVEIFDMLEHACGNLLEEVRASILHK